MGSRDTDCLSYDELAACAGGQLSMEAMDAVYQHLDGCSECRHLLVAVAQSTSHDAAAAHDPGLGPNIGGVESEVHGPGDEPIRRGTEVGRYVVSDVLGSGAMGVVYAARDPDLDREVALKMLKPSHTSTQRARRQLLLEGQVMGRLAHPNVVTVYDVGRFRGQVFIAMEFVRGATLRQWVATTKPDWDARMSVLVAAGRGLAAAHQAGIVHRDFKPENVLVGADGRVCVTDFGLATGLPAAVTHDGPLDIDATATWSQHGVVVGTPRYMSPEQHAGQSCGPKSDQFSYCVVVHEALFGVLPARPWLGAVATAPGRVVHAPSEGHLVHPRAKAAIQRALSRGLASAPADRWPTMDALLEALVSGSARRPRRRWVAAAAVGVAAVTSLGGLAWAKHSQRCTGAEAELAEFWGEEHQKEVEAAILRTKLRYAPATWERVQAGLQRYATDWARMHADVCEATSVRAEQSTEVMDLRMACLYRARLKFASAIGVLATADAGVVGSADEVVGGLSSLQECEDVDALRAQVPPPGARQAAAVEQIRSLVAQAQSQRRGRRLAEAVRTMDAAQSLAQGVSYGPIRAEVAFERGEISNQLEDSAAAKEALREALTEASHWHQWDVMQAAAAELMGVLGEREWRFDEALSYRPLAQGLAEEGSLAEASWRGHLAAVRARQGKLEEAETESRMSVSIRTQLLGNDHPDVAGAVLNLARVLAMRGQYDEAEQAFRHALEIRERVFGAEHPAVAEARDGLGTALAGQGKYREAHAEHRRALADLDRAGGVEGRAIVAALTNLANVVARQGRPNEAEQHSRRALELAVATLGADHGSIPELHSNLCGVLFGMGRLEEAEVQCRIAVSDAETRLGESHPKTLRFASGLAVVFAVQGHLAAAEREFRRLVPLIQAGLGKNHPEVVSLRLQLANALLDQAKYAEAESEVRLVLADLNAALGPDHVEIASGRGVLGQALLGQGRRTEATVELRQAVDGLTRVLGPDHPRTRSVRSALAEADKHAQAR